MAVILGRKQGRGIVMTDVFINLTNHPSVNWSPEQREAAHQYGEIVDMPFPNVAAEASAEEVARLAGELCYAILCLRPAAVLCQGEFTLCFAVVQRLQQAGITVLAACSERVTREEKLQDGSSRKTSIFRFVQFRPYLFQSAPAP